MKIVVHDTSSSLLDLLERPVSERPEALKEVLSPLQPAFTVMGIEDPVQMHQMLGSGFPLDRDDQRYAPALRQMTEFGVWEQISEQLERSWKHLSGAMPGVKHAETVDVVLVLGNPDDEYLTVESAGYFGFGGIPGSIHLVMWPTETSLRKIGHAAAHELNHNVRFANVVWNPMTVTVGEHVVSEGLAEAFVREVGGEAAMGPWTRAVTGADLDAAYEKIVAHIDLAGQQNLTPYVLGDTATRRMGQEPVGLPDLAGYPVGLRIVDAHLAASGLTAAQSIALPAREILRNAGVPTNA